MSDNPYDPRYIQGPTMPTSTGGGLSGAFMGALPGIGSVLGGGLSSFFAGRQDVRNRENELMSSLALDKNLNPNRPLNAALDRNIRGNFLQNFQNVDQNATGADYFNQLAGAYGKSLQGGINPELTKGLTDMSTIPGLRAGAIQNPDYIPEFKKPGILESMGVGLAGLF